MLLNRTFPNIANFFKAGGGWLIFILNWFIYLIDVILMQNIKTLQTVCKLRLAVFISGGKRGVYTRNRFDIKKEYELYGSK